MIFIKTRYHSPNKLLFYYALFPALFNPLIPFFRSCLDLDLDFEPPRSALNLILSYYFSVVGISFGIWSYYSARSNSAQLPFYKSFELIFILSIQAISFYCMANMSSKSLTVRCWNSFSCFLFYLNSTWNSAKIDLRLSFSFLISDTSFLSFLFFCFISP